MSWLFFLILIQHEYKEAKLAKVTKVSMEFAINNPQIATKKADTFASHSNAIF